SGADDGVRARAGAALTGVGLGARVAIIAGGTVRLGGIGARAGLRVADAGLVALVGGAAHDRAGPGAGAGPAGVVLGAGVAVVARAGDVRVHAAARGIAGVPGADVAVIAVGRWPADARPARAGVVGRAGATVVAGRRVVDVDAALDRIAGVVGARVAVVAVRSGAADAVSRGASIGGRAGVAVGAGGPVGLRRIRADTARGIAGPGEVTLVLGGADDPVGPRAGPALTGIGARTGVVVVAGGGVGLRRVRAGAGRGIAGPGGVTLIGRRAADRVGAHAGAGTVARIGLRT